MIRSGANDLSQFKEQTPKIEAALGNTPNENKSLLDAPSLALRECFDELLQTYLSERRNPYGAQSKIWSPFQRMKVALEGIGSVSTRKDLMCTWSAGKGVWAAVPWIALLDKRETT